MKFLFDVFPLVLFFGAYKLYGIYVATATAIIASIAQVSIFWLRNRRFETMHLITLGVIILFGGLTLLFRDDAFIKWKPSIVNWLFSFFLIVGLLNLYVAFYYRPELSEQVRTDFWVNFKVFGLMGLTLVFAIGQMLCIAKYLKPEHDENL